MTDLPIALSTTCAVPCADHPDTETRLRCSRCGKPICPRCAVRTPVGMRCPDCAGTRAAVKANPAGVLKAAAAGIVVATLAGVGWGVLPDWGFYWALILGFGAVESMAYLLRARQGLDLQLIALAIVGYGMLLSRVVLGLRLGVDVRLINDFSAPLQYALYLRPIPDLLFMLMPLAIAWIRFR